LTNHKVEGFDPAKRWEPDITTGFFHVLDKLTKAMKGKPE